MGEDFVCLSFIPIPIPITFSCAPLSLDSRPYLRSDARVVVVVVDRGLGFIVFYFILYLFYISPSSFISPVPFLSFSFMVLVF